MPRSNNVKNFKKVSPKKVNVAINIKTKKKHDRT